MALVILTDPRPVAALKRLISRVGFVLLPTSLLLIKYYANLGRGYGPGGEPSNTGVTTNKNTLGVMLFVISLCTLWHIITLLREKRLPNRTRHLVAQGTLLAFGAVLLGMARSDTSTACFLLGAILMIAAGLRTVRGRPARMHMVCLAIFLAGGLVLLSGGESEVTHAMGRKSNLSGRTDIWAALIPTVPNPIVGAGFEGFWLSPSAQQAEQTLRLEGWWHPEDLNEAHNGYIEVYLNLGLVGVALILLILISGYRRAVSAFRREPVTGGLFLAYIIASAFYSITEAGFRMLDLMWVFLLLATFGATGAASGLFGATGIKPIASRNGFQGQPRGLGVTAKAALPLPSGQSSSPKESPVNRSDLVS